MREWLKLNRNAIFAGVVSSVFFLYFLDPLLGFVARTLGALSALVGGAYLDRIYSQAAHLETVNYSFILFLGFNSFLSGISIGLMWILLQSRRTMVAETVVSRRDEDKRGSMGSVVVRARRTAESPSPVFRISVVGVGVIFNVGLLAMLAGNFVQLKVISTFNHHIRILAPYIGPKLERTLISEWSRMNSASDFEAVSKKLHAIATEHGISLPENVLFSPLTI